METFDHLRDEDTKELEVDNEYFNVKRTLPDMSISKDSLIDNELVFEDSTWESLNASKNLIEPYISSYMTLGAQNKSN